MSSTYNLAWWNLENLFDHRDAPRTDKLQRAIGSDLVNWTPELRDRKLDQLASIIRQLGGGLGPDLLGVCEVENATVLQMLVTRVAALTNRDYAFVHFDTSDSAASTLLSYSDRNCSLRRPTSASSMSSCAARPHARYSK